VSVVNEEGTIVPIIGQSEGLELDVEFVVRDPGVGKLDIIGITSLIDGTGVFCFELSDLIGSSIKWSAGSHRLRVRYPTDILNSGRYIARVCVALGHKAYHNHPNTGEGVSFEIIERGKTDTHRKRHTTDVCILSTLPTYKLDKVA